MELIKGQGNFRIKTCKYIHELFIKVEPSIETLNKENEYIPIFFVFGRI